MISRNYLPRENEARLEWLHNFLTKFPEYHERYDFSEIETASILRETKAFIDFLKEAENTFQDKEGYDKVKSQYDNTPVPAWLRRRLARTIQRIKTHPDFHEETGRALSLYAPETSMEASQVIYDRYDF